MLVADFVDHFYQERARFARYVPRIASTRLRWITGPCGAPGKCTFRDLAYAEPENNTVVFNTRVLELPFWNATALLRHELSHLSDPVPYVVGTGREQWADDYAERVTGERIFYDARDVQTLLPGKWPRPTYLHR